MALICPVAEEFFFKKKCCIGQSTLSVCGRIWKVLYEFYDIYILVLVSSLSIG